MGSLEDYKGFGALHPQFWGYRTPLGPMFSSINLI